ncbi:hypothetical protein M0R45_016519 [Rubus argutus]|uniref:Uncharacterized protein n=1 Tax=Rubus argutus TaxID=59490 RepID=A0AAW1XUT1_RUBAR
MPRPRLHCQNHIPQSNPWPSTCKFTKPTTTTIKPPSQEMPLPRSSAVSPGRAVLEPPLPNPASPLATTTACTAHRRDLDAASGRRSSLPTSRDVPRTRAAFAPSIHRLLRSTALLTTPHRRTLHLCRRRLSRRPHLLDHDAIIDPNWRSPLLPHRPSTPLSLSL